MNIKICIIGLGYVGLPMSCVLSEAGYQIIGIDINKEYINKLKKGQCNYQEPDLKKLLKQQHKQIQFYDNISQIPPDTATYIICVPTPITNEGEPDLNPLMTTITNLLPQLRNNELIIIESSIPPGTIKKIIGCITKKIPKKRIGKTFHISYCPERLFPTNVITELKNNPRIIASTDPNGYELTKEIYQKFSKGKITQTNFKTAEIIKLVENTVRDINIATANEIAQICELYGADAREVIEIANEHPRTKILNPSVNVGGTCIPKDPILLAYMCEKEKYTPNLLKAARNINKNIPIQFADRIQKNLKLNNLNLLILGEAYKANTNNTTNSATYTIKHELEKMNHKITIFDPIVNKKQRIEQLYENKEKYNAIIITTDHNIFKTIDWKKLSQTCTDNFLIADGKRMLNEKELNFEKRYKYIGIGK